MADWNYEFAQCLELTVYTGCCHSPSEDTLLQLWKAHYPALVASIQQVSYSTTSLCLRGLQISEN